MPSKLTGMLSSGRPVIATADPGTQVAEVVSPTAPADGLIPHPPCGLVVPAEAPQALHAATARLIADATLRATLGTAARRYAIQHLGKQQVLEAFETQLIAVQ
jgi:colanic acid biosynthesis glycosyl transferase WcaI